MKKVAFLTSGGDAPGMNACIRAIVRASLYHNIVPVAVYGGYSGLVEGNFQEMGMRSVANIIHKGGTIIKSSRSKEFRTPEGRKKAYEQLKKNDIENLIVIGGDGTFTGASKFCSEHKVKVVGIPGTIDFDIYGTDYTIGFDTALNTVVEAVDKIRDTAESHSRAFIVEVMGRDSGFLALRSGLAVGAQEIIVPETRENNEKVFASIASGLKRKKGSMIIIVAEKGGEPGHSFEVAKQIEEKYPEMTLRVSILGHMQRGGNPTCFDRVSSSRLGSAAVERLLKGESNIMIGFKNLSITTLSIEEAVKNEKKLNTSLLNLLDILRG